MKTLVIGGTGLVGYEFYRQKKNDGEWRFTYRREKMDEFVHLDANDKDEIEKVMSEFKPETVIMTAAMPNVNLCEKEPEKARENNVGILENIIESMKRNNGKRIVFISTDYLFDGKEGP